MASRISDYLGLVRFSHTVFALPFAALATVMAFATPLPDSRSGEYPEFGVLPIIGILLCMVLARSAAMSFNRLVDHKIDAANPRTEKRHLPAGILSRRSVVIFTLVCAFGFVASTLLFWPNWVPLVLSIPVMFFLLGYSMAKRFTSAAHLWLGVALSLSPICAWLAIRGPESIFHPEDLITPGLLAGAVAAWVMGFDIIYACQDAEYDQSVELHSVPAKFGIAGALRIAAISHAVMLGLLGLLAWVAGPSGFGWVFVAVLVVVAMLVIRQHALVKPDDLDRINQAFFDTNALISVTLLVGGTVDCYLL